MIESKEQRAESDVVFPVSQRTLDDTQATEHSVPKIITQIALLLAIRPGSES